MIKKNYWMNILILLKRDGSGEKTMKKPKVREMRESELKKCYFEINDLARTTYPVIKETFGFKRYWEFHKSISRAIEKAFELGYLRAKSELQPDFNKKARKKLHKFIIERFPDE